MKKYFILLLVAAVLVVLVIVFNKQGTNGNETKSLATDYQTLYDDTEWHPIVTDRLQWLTPSSDNRRFTSSVIERKSNDCEGTSAEHLRIEGGLCTIGYYLEAQTEGQSPIKIRNEEQLRAAFAPVDNEQEAAAFVAVTVDDLQLKEPGRLDGNTATTDDGYLVQVIRKNTFGCGSHVPSGLIYRVNKQGQIELIAQEPKKPSDEPQLCVD